MLHRRNKIRGCVSQPCGLAILLLSDVSDMKLQNV